MAHIIDNLFRSGLDFMPNHYSIILPTAITQISGIVDPLTLRIHKVNIPERKIGTYQVYKRGRFYDRPNAKNENEKTVSFSFRPDKKLKTYNAIVAWMQYIQNNETMSMASDSGPTGDGGASLFRAPVEIWSIDSLDTESYAGRPTNIWTLEGVFPTSISGIEFDDNGGDDPLDVDVTLTCFNIIYPKSVG